VFPSVDPEKCEDKGECVSTCPYEVFELGIRTAEEISELSFIGRIEARAHGNRMARTSHIDMCHVCGDCVIVCSEKAIRLLPR